jgi:hypothetical protein
MLPSVPPSQSDLKHFNIETTALSRVGSPLTKALTSEDNSFASITCWARNRPQSIPRAEQMRCMRMEALSNSEFRILQICPVLAPLRCESSDLVHPFSAREDLIASAKAVEFTFG